MIATKGKGTPVFQYLSGLLDQLHLRGPTLWNNITHWRTTAEVPVMDFMEQWLPLYYERAPKTVFVFRCCNID